MLTHPRQPSADGHFPRAASRPSRGLLALAFVTPVVLTGCATPTPSPSASAAPSVSLSPSLAPSISIAPTPTPERPLSLATPAKHDAHRISFAVNANVPATGTGQLTIHVVNLSNVRIPEIVVRWPTPLARNVFLAPFQPSPRRLTTLLIQPWTKWVIGPGEQGEPAGTTSLGWGPLLPGASLDIALFATRRAAGAVSFDLQFLSGEAILTSQSGGIAETRVTIH
jgi:hypothetical protein